MTQKLDNDFLNRFILKFPNRNGIILRLTICDKKRFNRNIFLGTAIKGQMGLIYRGLSYFIVRSSN